MNKFDIGVVEDRQDPLMLGRCRVRVVGVHTEDKSVLPTADLPWATPLQGITSAAMSGIGETPVGPIEGTWVAVTFFDEEKQFPVMMGTFAGIPGDKSFIADTSWLQQEDKPILPDPVVQVKTPVGVVNTNADGSPIITHRDAPPPPADTKYLGSLTVNQHVTWQEAVAELASGKDYSKIGAAGHLGKYQFGTEALEELGYVKAGTWSRTKSNDALQDDSVWTGKNDITSLTVWLASQETQELVMDVYAKTNFSKLMNSSVVNNDSIPEKLAGILTVAHFQGSVVAKQYLSPAQIDQPNDTTGLSSSGIYRYGYKAILGKETSEAPTTQNMGNEAVDKSLPTRPDAKKYDVSGSTQLASRGTPQYGFLDGSGRYPRKDHLNEPDTNRLARGQNIAKTIVGEKESDRTVSIPIANSSSVWSQPPVPYNAKYPFNRVFASESGHVLEFDDTEGFERINLHHRSGTFLEIDNTGIQVNKVKSHRVSIVEANDFVYIKGSGHVAVDGDITLHVGKGVQIFVTGDASVQVQGTVFADVQGDVNVKSGGSTNIDAGGDLNLKAGGSVNIDAGGTMNMKAGGMIAGDGSQIHWNSGMSQPADPATAPSEYSADIPVFATPTRHEAEAMRLEDSPEGQAAAAQEAETQSPVEPQEEDNTMPENTPTIIVTECDFVLPLTNETQLSTNYTIGSLCKDGAFPFETGQHGLSAQQLACNLKQLAVNVIEPLRERYGVKGFVINSCFRPKGSKISQSNRISQHELGQAVDIGFKPKGGKLSRQQYFDIAKEIKDSLPFDQVLNEYRGPESYWIHVSFKTEGNRAQVLTMKDDRVFAQGLVLLA